MARLQVSLGLPTHRVDLGPEFGSLAAITEIARVAEAAGFAAVFTSDHPAPPVAWMAKGGHHTIDPFVVLSAAAAVTESLRLHTNLFVPAYRHPLIGAKLAASLDAVSGGRLILGVGAGYVEGEFAAVAADFAGRNDRLDEAIRTMQAAWSGEPFVAGGAEVVQLPVPVQRPGPPIWIGGNSRRAMRRAVELGQGWNPMPSPKRASHLLRTPGIESLHDLAERIAQLRDLAEIAGRSDPLDVAFMPAGLDMFNAAPVDAGRVRDELHRMAGIGVTWATVMLPGESRTALLRAVERFGEQVIRELDEPRGGAATSPPSPR